MKITGHAADRIPRNSIWIAIALGMLEIGAATLPSSANALPLSLMVFPLPAVQVQRAPIVIAPQAHSKWFQPLFDLWLVKSETSEGFALWFPGGSL
jgi:hypothetical protein